LIENIERRREQRLMESIERVRDNKFDGKHRKKKIKEI
jgi:hypothetical protein